MFAPMNSIADTGPQPCGLPRRLMAMLYDALVVTALWILAAAIALPLTGGEVQAGRDPLYTVYLLAWWFAYQAGCSAWAGQTVGMRAWKVAVVDGQGRTPGWAASAGRFFAAWLSALPAGLGFIAALWHPQRLAWHDRLSGTRLLRLPESSD